MCYNTLIWTGNRKVLWKPGAVAQPSKSEYEPCPSTDKYLARDEITFGADAYGSAGTGPVLGACL